MMLYAGFHELGKCVSSLRRRSVVLKSACVGLAFLAIGLANPTDAYANGFTLGEFDFYGLLINDGTANADINTAPVNTNIGVGTLQSGKTVNLHNEVVNGRVDFENTTPQVSGGAITGTQPCSRGGACPGGSLASVNSNVSRVSTAISDALALSTYYGGQTGTNVTLGGNTTINATRGTLDPTGTYIFNATNALTIGNGNTLTINGSVADYVALNISTASGNKLDGALSLTGGITPDHVLINFTGSGANLQGAANKATLMATFLVPGLKVQLNSLTIAGHLFGGAAGQDFQFVSNALIKQPDINVVPLPASLPLFASGFGALVLAGWRKRRKSVR